MVLATTFDHSTSDRLAGATMVGAAVGRDVGALSAVFYLPSVSSIAGICYKMKFGFSCY